jgi:hypothetical protein
VRGNSSTLPLKKVETGTEGNVVVVSSLGNRTRFIVVAVVADDASASLNGNIDELVVVFVVVVVVVAVPALSTTKASSSSLLSLPLLLLLLASSAAAAACSCAENSFRLRDPDVPDYTVAVVVSRKTEKKKKNTTHKIQTIFFFEKRKTTVTKKKRKNKFKSDFQGSIFNLQHCTNKKKEVRIANQTKKILQKRALPKPSSFANAIMINRRIFSSVGYAGSKK